MGTIEEHDGFISGMLALLECGGLLFVNDIGEWRPAFRKVLKIKREQKVARHNEVYDGAFEIYRESNTSSCLMRLDSFDQVSCGPNQP